MTDEEIEQFAIESGCYYTAVDRKTCLLVLRPSLYKFARLLLAEQAKRNAGYQCGPIPDAQFGSNPQSIC